MESISAILSKWLERKGPTNGQNSTVGRALPSKEENKAPKLPSARNKVLSEAKIQYFIPKFHQFITSVKGPNFHWIVLKEITRSWKLSIYRPATNEYWAISRIKFAQKKFNNRKRLLLIPSDYAHASKSQLWLILISINRRDLLST